VDLLLKLFEKACTNYFKPIEQKRKYELIHKATVKSQYYKELNKEKDEDTPDYVKEVL
jgi:hypothetical protein